MKEIRTEDAVGHILCHDITQIIKDVKKGVLFKKGHIVREEDIPQIMEEYDALAKEMIAREKAGKGFNFFHFMIDLTGGPCVYKRILQ